MKRNMKHKLLAGMLSFAMVISAESGIALAEETEEYAPPLNREYLTKNSDGETEVAVDGYAIAKKSIEVTFNIEGLEQPLADIAAGTYSDPEIDDGTSDEKTVNIVLLDKVMGPEDVTDLQETWNDTSNLLPVENEDGADEDASETTDSTRKDNGTVRKDLSAKDLVDNEMGMGVNLGNTFEAVLTVENKATATNFESAWGNPVTTREYIDYLHSLGVNTIRIPVAWSNGDLDDGTYHIREELLNRVEEVVNYALDDGMYVIINDHWDNQWWGQFGACKYDTDGETKIADEEVRAQAWTRFESYWTQISEHFKDYSDHLIFEGANEELGDRLNDAICINGPAKGYAKPNNATSEIKTITGNLTASEQYETTNAINQKFVDTVRNTGGNNAYRFLLMPGFNTDISKTTSKKYILPNDPAEEETGVKKLLVSVHFYSPWDFCGDVGGGYYTEEDQKSNLKSIEKLKQFSDQGYGIVIGECGVCEPSSVTGSVTQWFYDTFKAAKEVSAVPVLWETGAIFDRTTPQILYKDIAIFLNAINGTNGTYTTDRVSGGVLATGESLRKMPDYLDPAVWDMYTDDRHKTQLHAYLFFQTSTWDYRDAYKPMRALTLAQHSWDYVKAGGGEISAETSQVQDAVLDHDGEYTLSLTGADLSAANSYQMLGISTDIRVDKYPDVKITSATLKIDGEPVTEVPVVPTHKTDQKYWTFMFMNSYYSGDFDNVLEYVPTEEPAAPTEPAGSDVQPGGDQPGAPAEPGSDQPAAPISSSGAGSQAENPSNVTAAPTDVAAVPTDAAAAPAGTAAPTNTAAAPTSSAVAVSKLDQELAAEDMKLVYGKSEDLDVVGDASSDSTLTYETSDDSIVTVDENGTVTAKGYGKATITIKASETNTYKAATATCEVTVVPKKVTAKKVVKSGKKVKVTWKADKTVSGYQIIYSKKSTLKSAKKLTISKAKISTKIAKISLKGRVYFQIRAYAKKDGVTYYGEYSKKMSVKL